MFKRIVTISLIALILCGALIALSLNYTERTTEQGHVITIGQDPLDPDEIRELRYIAREDGIHKLARDAQFTELRKRKDAAFRVLQEKLAAADLRIQTDSDGESGYIKTAYSAMVPQVKEMLCKDGAIEWADKLSSLRQAGIGRLFITTSSENESAYAEIFIGQQRQCENK